MPAATPPPRPGRPPRRDGGRTSGLRSKVSALLQPRNVPAAPSWRSRLLLAASVATLLAAGVLLRMDWMNRTALWCDEAESSINALTIQDRGLPLNEYLGIPVFENTLTDPWDGHPEYEFRDSSYSPQGLAVYHGWLPLYAIAASQALAGVRPDRPESPPQVRHGVADIPLRTVAPRLPSIAFSALCLVLIFFLARQLGGNPAGLAALTLMAFNARTVDFGYQARYYSATLLMTVLAGWSLLQTIQRGRWRDFLLLGLAEALLFHTHQFSAVVFAAACLFATPAIARQRSWFWKSLAGGGLAAALILPWVWFSGFLFTASNVPKAHKLFDSLADWLEYTLDRPDQLAILGALALVLVFGKWIPGRMAAAVRSALAPNKRIYAFLLAWLLAGYAAFHLIVPAASFFYERLSLVLWTPYVLLLALLTSDALRRFRPLPAAVLAVAAMCALLTVRGRMAFLNGPAIPSSRAAIASVIRALERLPVEQRTRYYATPNEHLTYTYYCGIPVQSVAPVRRAFFETYRGPIIFLESQMEWMFPAGSRVRSEAAVAGRPLTREHIDRDRARVWTELVTRELQQRGLPSPPRTPLPDYLKPVVSRSARDLEDFRVRFKQDMRSSPIFRKVQAASMKDFWLGFFFRFVNPEDRIGKNQNIFPRLASATITFVPEANVIIYRIPPSATRP